MSSPPVCAQVAMPLLLPLAPLVGAPAAVAIVVIGVAVVAAALIVMTGWHKRTVDGYAGLPAPPPAPKVERGPGAAGPFPPQKDRCANRSLGRVRRNACSHAPPSQAPLGALRRLPRERVGSWAAVADGKGGPGESGAGGRQRDGRQVPTALGGAASGAWWGLRALWLASEFCRRQQAAANPASAERDRRCSCGDSVTARERILFGGSFTRVARPCFSFPSHNARGRRPAADPLTRRHAC